MKTELLMLEELLAITEQFKPQMKDDALRTWCRVAAATADIRELTGQVIEEGYELDDGGVIEWPDEQGTMRRIDKDGNCEEIRRPGDVGYEDWIHLFV